MWWSWWYDAIRNILVRWHQTNYVLNLRIYKNWRIKNSSQLRQQLVEELWAFSWLSVELELRSWVPQSLSRKRLGVGDCVVVSVSLLIDPSKVFSLSLSLSLVLRWLLEKVYSVWIINILVSGIVEWNIYCRSRWCHGIVLFKFRAITWHSTTFSTVTSIVRIISYYYMLFGTVYS